MKLNRVPVLAVMLIAALGVGTGTSYADPPPVSDQSINYRTTLAPDGRSVETAIDAGMFRLAGATVDVVDDSGTTLTTIPLRYSVAGAEAAIAPLITDDGSRLVLTPDTSVFPGLRHDVDKATAYTNMIKQIEIGWQNGGSMSASIGAGIGAVVGCILFLFVGCIPGAAIGGAIGAYNGINNANPAVTPAIFEFIGTP